MAPTFTLEPDRDRFGDRVLPFLEADPVPRTLPLTVLDSVLGGLYPEWVLAHVTAPDGTVRATAVQTPPHNVIVAAESPDDVESLARGLREHGLEFPGVVGMAPLAQAFAAAWCAGRSWTSADDRASRLFRLDDLVGPRAARGSARLATTEDLDLVLAWFEAFVLEISGVRAGDIRSAYEKRIAEGRVVIWETDEAVVSYLGYSPVLAGHARIGPVYTPPAHRGLGYASNLVAHASQHLLELGAVPTLFTDLANPTSNAIYQAIGYRPVGDAAEISFQPTAA